MAPVFSLVAAPAAGRETPLAAHLSRGEKQTAAGSQPEMFLSAPSPLSPLLSPLSPPSSLEGHLGSARQGRRARGAGGGGDVGSSAHLVRPDPLIATSNTRTGPSPLAPPASGYNKNAIFGTEKNNLLRTLRTKCYISASQ